LNTSGNVVHRFAQIAFLGGRDDATVTLRGVYSLHVALSCGIWHQRNNCVCALYYYSGSQCAL